MALRLGSRQPEVAVNLLPRDIKQKQNVQRIFSLVLIGAAAILVILGIITVVQRLQISSQESKLEDLQAKAATLRTEVESLRKYEELKAEVDRRRSALATALAGDISWTHFLDDLDSFMPTDSWLDSLSVTATVGTTPDGQVSLGTAQYAATVRQSFPSLAHWLDVMSEVDGLRFVYLGSGQKSESASGEPIITFGANAHVTETMLSGRCAGEGAQCP